MVVPAVRVNVEQPRVAWLSSPEYTKPESFTTLQDQIKDIVEGFHKCEDVDDCEHFLRGKHGHPQYEQIFLIVTNDYIHPILSRDIHDVRVLQAILIFNPKSPGFSFAFKQYPKIEGIYSSSADLLMQLSTSVDNFSKESGILLSTLKGWDVEMTTSIINNFADFSELWFPLFIDLIFDLPTLTDSVRARDIQHFANQCQRFYAHNQTMLTQIEMFLSSSGGYSSNAVAEYYTRDLFFYRRVNKALRQQNFQVILDFRFFLVDMENQLQVAYPQFSNFYCVGDEMVFYRGQGMSKQELDSLNEQRRTGSLITVNSYLSSSISRDIAKGFIRSCQDSEIVPVIFEIYAKYKDPTVIRRKPFAYIGHLSHYLSAELEVLFSIGSFFSVDKIGFDEKEKIHIIKLTFIYDEEHYTITDDYGALRTCSLEEKLLKTGDLLYNHPKHGAIKAYGFYQHFLSDANLPLIRAACQNGLGWLAVKQKQFELAIAHQEKALQIYQSFQNEDCLNYLYITSYCCIGAVYKQQKQYPKALSYYQKAHEVGATIIPIDKYAFSNTFNHIALVNIACIQKIQGAIDRAWRTYKTLLANQMKKSTRFHGATYLKIAEAGFSDDVPLGKDKQQTENWKSFLDLSLTDMSSTYRRSIVSGVLSINLRFADNEQNRNNIIDYYKKIIQISHKYINISDEDYCIVIQCCRRMAELYRKTRSYVMSLKYAADGVNLCRINDLESYTMFYESMTQTYEQQIEELNSNLSPEDIDCQISPDISPHTSLKFLCRTTSTFHTIVLHFERDEFSFGQFKKSLNSDLFKEPNLKRCLAYCLLKVAALKNEPGQTEDIRNLLCRVSTLICDDDQIRSICANNLAYLDGDFNKLINIYKTSLKESPTDPKKLCIGEDAFCYIAHLYGRKNDPNAELEWYTNAIKYFRDYKFICQHTRSCFAKMASHYQTKNDFPSCVSTYGKLVHHLLDYRSETYPFQRHIVFIVESIVRQLNTDGQDQIDILKHLVQLVLRPSQDIDLVDADFQWIINRYIQKRKQSWVTTHAYESYLDQILLHITHPLTPYLQTIIPAFRQVTMVYKLIDDLARAFDIYQRLIEVILKYSMDRHHIISTFKQIALELEKTGQTQAVLDIYDALRQFIYAYRTNIAFQDDDLIFYILIRHETLIERDKEAAASIYRVMIRLVRSYREDCNREYELKQYLNFLEKYYTALAQVEPLSALDCYGNLLDIFLNLCPENYATLLAKIVNTMQDRSTVLLELLTRYRCNYQQLIDDVNKRLLNPNDRSLIRQPLPQTRFSHINNIVSSYATKAQRCFTISKGEKSIIECWTKCLYFLLEFCSEYDEYTATCYTQLGDPVRAANVFDSTLYCNFGLKYCPNACRRYLKYVYPQAQMREELELYFADHFYFIDGRKEIRPLEPVNY